MIRYYATSCEGYRPLHLAWTDPATGHWYRGAVHAPIDQGPLDGGDLQTIIEQDARGRTFTFVECRYLPGQRHLRVNRGEHVTFESLDPDERKALLGCLTAVPPLVQQLREAPLAERRAYGLVPGPARPCPARRPLVSPGPF